MEGPCATKIAVQTMVRTGGVKRSGAIPLELPTQRWTPVPAHHICEYVGSAFHIGSRFRQRFGRVVDAVGRLVDEGDLERGRYPKSDQRPLVESRRIVEVLLRDARCPKGGPARSHPISAVQQRIDVITLKRLGRP